jgi:hypothetical protein
MSGQREIDYQRKAQEAVKMAAAASGFDRLEWLRVAQAWLALGRERANPLALGPEHGKLQLRRKSLS